MYTQLDLASLVVKYFLTRNKISTLWVPSRSQVSGATHYN